MTIIQDLAGSSKLWKKGWSYILQLMDLVAKEVVRVKTEFQSSPIHRLTVVERWWDFIESGISTFKGTDGNYTLYSKWRGAT